VNSYAEFKELLSSSRSTIISESQARIQGLTQ
jgi:hypothetical protein